MNQEEKNKRLVKGITIVFIANVIGAVFNVALNFLLPKYLSVDAYAGIKAYELYYTFVSIATLGFIDGVYLEYGGVSIQSVEKSELAIRINTLRWLQLTIMILLIPVAILLDDDVFFYFALSVPTLNIINLFQLLYQATGEYSRYSRILNVTTISKAIISLLLLLFVSRDDYRIYLVAYVIMSLGISLWQEYSIRIKNIGKQPLFLASIGLLIREIKDGVVLRIGVLSGFLLSGMDRIFVKKLMDTNAFALYSFAATVENLLNVMITPITTTMYNFFCDNPNSKTIIRIRNVITIASLGILTAFFPVKIVLSLFIRNYLGSLVVLAILFASKSLYMVIQGVYINLYKARRMQNKYLIKLLVVIAIGLVSNILFYLLSPLKESFAIATLITSIIWMIFSAHDFKDVNFNIKEIVYYFMNLSVFLICACLLNAIVGMALYILFLILFTRILMHAELNILISYIYKKLKRQKADELIHDK